MEMVYIHPTSKSLKSKIHEELTKMYVAKVWQYFSRIVCFGVRNKNASISGTIRALRKFCTNLESSVIARQNEIENPQRINEDIGR